MVLLADQAARARERQSDMLRRSDRARLSARDPSRVLPGLQQVMQELREAGDLSPDLQGPVPADCQSSADQKAVELPTQ